jgi:hypothetical protein
VQLIGLWTRLKQRKIGIKRKGIMIVSTFNRKQIIIPKPKAEKEASGKYGFVVIPVRWVVERSNAWVERCKSLVRTLDNANARLKLCFIRLMLKRLARAS